MHLPSRSQKMTLGTAAICGQCSLHRISKFAISCAHINIIIWMFWLYLLFYLFNFGVFCLCREGDVVSLHLLQLAFGERKCLASGKIIYEVQSCAGFYILIDLFECCTVFTSIYNVVAKNDSFCVWCLTLRVWSIVRSVTVRNWTVQHFPWELRPPIPVWSAVRP